MDEIDMSEEKVVEKMLLKLFRDEIIIQDWCREKDYTFFTADNLSHSSVSEG